MEDQLNKRARPAKDLAEEAAAASLRWVPLFSLFLAAAMALGMLFFRDYSGHPVGARKLGVLGHITRAYGTVKRIAWSSTSTAGDLFSGLAHPVGLDESWNRLETGRDILVPFGAGDVVQTGEESEAELLFFGGGTLTLDAGTLARFEDNGDSVSVRLVIGKAHIDLTHGMGYFRSLGKLLTYRKADGTYDKIPAGKRLVLTLNAAQPWNDGSADDQDELPSGMNLELLSDEDSEEPLIVPPLRAPASLQNEGKDQGDEMSLVPRALTPENDGDVDVESHPNLALHWQKVPGFTDDPVVAYEVEVRPAPGYEVEDTARKVQVFRRRKQDFQIQKVNGGGVFLWTVRAVTEKGERGPASAPRWLEIKFPKILRAPEVIKPKVE